MEENPQVAAQLDRVKDIIEKLSLNKGVNIEVQDDSLESLPEGEDLDTVQEDVPGQIEEVSEEEAIDEELAMKLTLTIRELGLSRRVNNCLESVRIETVGQLVQMQEVDLLKIRNFGKASLREVKRKLADIGLLLGMRNV